MGSVSDPFHGREDERSLGNVVGACDDGLSCDFYGGDQRNPSTRIVAAVNCERSSGDNTEIPYSKFQYTYPMEGNHNTMSEPRNLESHGDMRKSLEGKHGSYFPKWRLPSKIRRKFRASDEDSASKEADHLNENNTSVATHSPRNTLRACVDCNTTKTPLWRSGPQGPKSLCNACGIRHRKKRRALFASLGHDVVESVKPKKRTNSWDAASAIKKQNRSNKARVDDLDKIPLKVKLLAFYKGMEKDLYGNFSKGHSHAAAAASSSSSSSSAIERRFAQEEEEAARLLVAISYGLVLA